jgi:thiol-disulfide isomerase/thioredoxin
MKNSLLVLFALSTNLLFAQNKNTIFYDSLGHVTTWEEHWAQVVTGRYKSIYDKPGNRKTLVRMTRDEFEAELRKTENRITKVLKPETNFPGFDVRDIEGNRLASEDLKGKVVVLNFWFIGCGPCEMERPSLNDLVRRYEGNQDVVFIAFAKNEKEHLIQYLQDSPLLYQVVPTEKDFIKTKFIINAYPVNIILDRDGNYFYHGTGSGVGILTILQKEIEKALKG